MHSQRFCIVLVPPREFVGEPFEFVGEPFEFVGEPFEFVGEALEFVGEALEFVGEPLEFVGRPRRSLGGQVSMLFPRRQANMSSILLVDKQILLADLCR